MDNVMKIMNSKFVQIVFDNFKVTYPGFDQCRKNVVFRQHPGAPDAAMGTYLTNTVCQNCDDDAKFDLISSAGGLGWFGGCGSMVCTGMRNMLVYDKDGKFLGKKGIVIGDNREFGDVCYSLINRIIETNGM